MNVSAITQTKEGNITHLRGKVILETTDMLLKADEVDYDEDKDYAEARGHVYFKNYKGGEIIEADKVEYYLKSEQGKYYGIHGTTPAKIDVKPGLLTTSSPFYFEGETADRNEDRYILHHGYITDCKVPRPWWTFHSPRFDIIPGDRAIAYQAIFKLRKIPIFYLPYFYKSLEKVPRNSGFLTPNIGNSSTRGFMLGGGYFWAINRSYDLTYRGQYFSALGFAHQVDFRGKPTENSEFNAYAYGVQAKNGGFLATVNGKADLGDGFYLRGNLNYLSSLQFRQTFTESYSEAIYSEVSSVASITKQWSTFSADLVAQRDQNFQSTNAGDVIVIEKLPQLEFRSRDHEISDLPVYYSFNTYGGLVERSEPQFDSKRFVDRLNVEPAMTIPFSLAGIHLVPTFSVRGTQYSAELNGPTVVSSLRTRVSEEVKVDVILPSLARVYTIHGFLGDKLKHIIEPRVTYDLVRGVTDFNKLIRFDDTELLSDTNELEFSLTNRILTKSKGGEIREALSWEIRQKRYFDPTFGGALLTDRRNVLLSGLELTPYTFFDTPRNYSPVVSTLRLNPDYRVGIEWRADYDPVRMQIVNSLISADVHVKKWFMSAGHNEVRTTTLLSPPANEFRTLIGYGQENQKGFSAGILADYDYRAKVLRTATLQAGYNTDCCGLNLQFQRFSWNTRNENQIRVAFVVANIGSFGTLKRQERIF